MRAGLQVEVETETRAASAALLNSCQEHGRMSCLRVCQEKLLEARKEANWERAFRRFEMWNISKHGNCCECTRLEPCVSVRGRERELMCGNGLFLKPLNIFDYFLLCTTRRAL